MPPEDPQSHSLAGALIAALLADRSALEALRRLVAPEDCGADAPAPLAYTANTLAAELGVSPRTIRNAITRGELAAVKRGGRWIPAALVHHRKGYPGVGAVVIGARLVEPIAIGAVTAHDQQPAIGQKGMSRAE